MLPLIKNAFEGLLLIILVFGIIFIAVPVNAQSQHSFQSYQCRVLLDSIKDKDIPSMITTIKHSSGLAIMKVERNYGKEKAQLLVSRLSESGGKQFKRINNYVSWECKSDLGKNAEDHYFDAFKATLNVI